MSKGLDFPDNLMSIFGFKRVEEDTRLVDSNLKSNFKMGTPPPRPSSPLPIKRNKKKKEKQ